MCAGVTSSADSGLRRGEQQVDARVVGLDDRPGDEVRVHRRAR